MQPFSSDRQESGPAEPATPSSINCPGKFGVTINQVKSNTEKSVGWLRFVTSGFLPFSSL
jgi:hypothetical protein